MTPLTITIFWGIFGLVCLLFAAELFVRVSARLARIWNISPLITSLVIVALGTNVPEFAVSLGAIVREDAGLALGNLIGSSITNVTLIFGASILFGRVKPGTVKTQKNAWILLVITGLFCGMSLLHLAHSIQAMVLLASVCAVVSYQFLLGIRGRQNEDKTTLSRDNFKKMSPNRVMLYLGLLIIAMLLVWFGGNQVVVAITLLSDELQISTTFLGLTLAGLATTLPELITALTASFQRQNKVVIGTILGSNIFNLTLFPAIVFATVGTWYITPALALLLFGVTLLFFLVLLAFRGRFVLPVLGIVFLLAYFSFLSATTYLQVSK
ncbi:MAG: sodium:calcium antiporter [Candidatus Pacebacteria bacterium]|nr:sodium:calcium antiporter [Candidatus Paceibacterota bacterium]PIR60362.1 MAG: hypothetical protein COU67_02300 [Candidatus Pacebacteria bacterium CG10_big_fil_rev_8_21_14_0_10_44_54]